jgi:bilin biosynthesis protein
MSEHQPLSVDGQPQQLNQDEATQLAEELKQQIRNGVIPAGDSDSIERMVAGLGDPRGLMRLTFAESLGVVGKAAVPSLCRALSEHDSVTVRRAAAKTLTLIEDPRALPVLLKALLNDPDPVVQGSAVGAMAAVGAEAIDGLLEVLINPNSTAMQLGLASWGLAFVGGSCQLGAGLCWCQGTRSSAKRSHFKPCRNPLRCDRRFRRSDPKPR